MSTLPTRAGPMQSPEAFSYAPFYCEENVWHLARSQSLADAPRAVVFVTNAYRQCALFHQKAAPEPGAPVLWDYHVLLFVHRDGWQAWDLDSDLPLGTDVNRYLDLTFPATASLPVATAPRFRVLDADPFVRVFASDRSHMRAADGRWQAPPPSWPPILPSGVEPNLQRFLDLERTFVGDVLDLPGLRARFVGPHTGPGLR